MKINFGKKDLENIISAHLKSQGFNMKNKRIEVGAKAKHLGKGKGWDVTVVAEVIEEVPTEQSDSPVEPVPIFGGADE